MIYNNLPHLSNNTKDLILQLIHKHSFLRAGELQSLCREQFQHSVSRTTIHGHLKELQEENVITKCDGSYTFHPEWVKKIKEFGEGLGSEKKVNSYPAEVLEFSTLEELDNFYYNFKKDFVENLDESRENFMGTLAPHLCLDVLSLQENIHLMKSLVSNVEKKVVIKGNSELDGATRVMCERMGYEVVTGINSPFSYLVVVFNESVLLFNYHPSMQAAIEELFVDKDSSNEKYSQLYKTNLKHHILLVRDNRLASYYRHYIKSFF